MERYSRPVKGPSYGCSCRCCSITPRGFKIYFEDGEDRNAQHISWFDILKVVGLLAFYVGTSPHTQAALLRRVYNYTDLKRPLLWVVAVRRRERVGARQMSAHRGAVGESDEGE